MSNENNRSQKHPSFNDQLTFLQIKIILNNIDDFEMKKKREEISRIVAQFQFWIKNNSSFLKQIHQKMDLETFSSHLQLLLMNVINTQVKEQPFLNLFSLEKVLSCKLTEILSVIYFLLKKFNKRSFFLNQSLFFVLIKIYCSIISLDNKQKKQIKQQTLVNFQEKQCEIISYCNKIIKCQLKFQECMKKLIGPETINTFFDLVIQNDKTKIWKLVGEYLRIVLNSKILNETIYQEIFNEKNREILLNKLRFKNELVQNIHILNLLFDILLRISQKNFRLFLNWNCREYYKIMFNCFQNLFDQLKENENENEKEKEIEKRKEKEIEKENEKEKEKGKRKEKEKGKEIEKEKGKRKEKRKEKEKEIHIQEISNLYQKFLNFSFLNKTNNNNNEKNQLILNRLTELKILIKLYIRFENSLFNNCNDILNIIFQLLSQHNLNIQKIFNSKYFVLLFENFDKYKYEENQKLLLKMIKFLIFKGFLPKELLRIIVLKINKPKTISVSIFNSFFDIIKFDQNYLNIFLELNIFKMVCMNLNNFKSIKKNEMNFYYKNLMFTNLILKKYNQLKNEFKKNCSLKNIIDKLKFVELKKEIIKLLLILTNDKNEIINDQEITEMIEIILEELNNNNLRIQRELNNLLSSILIKKKEIISNNKNILIKINNFLFCDKAFIFNQEINSKKKLEITTNSHINHNKNDNEIIFKWTKSLFYLLINIFKYVKLSKKNQEIILFEKIILSTNIVKTKYSEQILLLLFDLSIESSNLAFFNNIANIKNTKMIIKNPKPIYLIFSLISTYNLFQKIDLKQYFNYLLTLLKINLINIRKLSKIRIIEIFLKSYSKYLFYNDDDTDDDDDDDGDDQLIIKNHFKKILNYLIGYNLTIEELIELFKLIKKCNNNNNNNNDKILTTKESKNGNSETLIFLIRLLVNFFRNQSQLLSVTIYSNNKENKYNYLQSNSSIDNIFPPKNGYTINIWLTLPILNNKQTVFLIANSSNKFKYKLSIKKGYLNLFIPNHKKIILKNFKFNQGLYQITICHEKSKIYGDKFYYYINGRFIESQKISYPIKENEGIFFQFGNNGKTNKNKAKNKSFKNINNQEKWSFHNFYLIQNILLLDEVRILYLLGPGYIKSFQKFKIQKIYFQFNKINSKIINDLGMESIGKFISFYQGIFKKNPFQYKNILLRYCPYSQFIKKQDNNKMLLFNIHSKKKKPILIYQNRNSNIGFYSKNKNPLLKLNILSIFLIFKSIKTSDELKHLIRAIKNLLLNQINYHQFLKNKGTEIFFYHLYLKRHLINKEISIELLKIIGLQSNIIKNCKIFKRIFLIKKLWGYSGLQQFLLVNILTFLNYKK
ncbi:protein fra10ac1 [Anaeramoeba flamelloides]|uniref:Protein fra10ac1 n=1 Tax=Anaeramoeba flamelloides TaxID=1746091 RepID=A0AAV7ZRL6_9EUKA|nr:protein fra10ac1 [Anaeramoeba flamelloides]